jgi:class 3 adenylate cyclase
MHAAPRDGGSAAPSAARPSVEHPPPWFSFRFKLLLSLVGSISLLLGLTLLVVRHETRVQIDATVTRATERSRVAFADLERLRQAELRRLGRRLTELPRMPAALLAVSEGQDPAELADGALYEMTLHGTARSLLAFTDLDGTAITALLDSAAVADPDAAVPLPLVETVLDGAVDEAFGYHRYRDRLFLAHTVLLEAFPVPVGTLTLAAEVDARVAAELGRAVGADVCFAVDGRCVAGTVAALDPELGRELEATARTGRTRYTTVRGHRLALLPDRITAPGQGEIWRVLALPLDGVIEPLRHVQHAAALAGLVALLLALLLASILSRGLTTPVRALAAATARVAEGDYGVRVAVSSRDELGALGRSFNAMTEGLLLKERYRGILDKVVSPEIAEELVGGEITLGGETRVVTTLFADMRGFTALTEGLGAHEVIALLNGFMEDASTAIEREGGVVDKYVGDQVMALFGAPIGRPDDALRAVRAALRIQAAARSASDAREAAGQPGLPVGIGLATGPVVAGNMGSASRLNYTVIGESVNLAARLCGRAGPYQILASGATVAAAGGGVEAVAGPVLELKGISRPAETFEITGLRSAAVAASGAGPAAVATVLAVVAGLLCVAPRAQAQRVPDPPTLVERGLVYSSPGGFLEVVPSGRLDLELFVPQEEPAWLIPARRSFVAGRGRLLLDVFAGERFYGLAELQLDRGEAPADQRVEARLRQAFLRFTPERLPVSVQAGTFVTPFGGYAQRHHTEADPLIRPPLLYDHRTIISSSEAPGASDAFLGWKDGVPREFRSGGAPVIWGTPYQAGALLFGTAGRVSFRLAAMNSAPSSEPEAWAPARDQWRAPSIVGHVAYQFTPATRVGASFNQGPFLEIPSPYGGVYRYDQTLVGVEAAFSLGLTEARAEFVWDRWQVPNVLEDPVDVSYYVELKRKLAAGLFAAARYGAIHFNEIARSDGGSEAWDHDVRRLQLGAGYRLNRAFELRGEYMWNRQAGPAPPRNDLLSFQAAWAF